MRTFVFSFFLILFSQTSAAFNPETNALYSFGSFVDTCGTMSENLLLFPGSEDTYMTYIAGVITGINLVTPSQADAGGGRDLPSFLAYVKKYCDEHPLDYVGSALHRLVFELTGKRADQLNAPSPPQKDQPK